MPREMSVVHHTNMSVTSSSSNASDGYESLGIIHEQALEEQVASLDVDSSSAMSSHWGSSVQSRMYTLGSTLPNGSPITQCKFAFLSCTIKKIKNS